MASISNLKLDDVPIVAYYGTGRLWSVHKDSRNRKTINASRSVAFEDCLTSSSNYKQMQDWVKNAAMAVLQQQQMPEAYKGYPIKDQLAGIANAVESILGPQGWTQFHFSVIHQELAMLHEDQGILPVSLLSDGIRAMISLVADLAWRCAKLNPHMKDLAPQKTSGIVLIDEVDMHLHPEWQQRVIGSLVDAFPNIQFIVTTHSPQVLSTIERQSIRELVEEEQDDGSKIVIGRTPDHQSRGVASNDLLAELQNTNPTPDVPEAKWLSEYKALIVQYLQHSPDGEALKQKILDHFGDQHPEWREIERLVRLQAIKAKIPKKSS
jgi:predicted ATP-binding protein involved in virulence